MQLFSELETKRYKKTNKCVLKEMPIYLEDDDGCEVILNNGTMTFTLFLKTSKV